MDQNKLVNFGRNLAKFPGIKNLKDIFINRKRKIFLNNKKYFEGKSGLEIGGPSPIFSSKGAFNTYTIARSIDNINWSSNTFWSEHVHKGVFNPYQSKELGREYLYDATKLPDEFEDKYDFIQSSHVLEHIANPIKAILSWRRSLKDGGVLLILVPDKRRTYDIDRKYTTLKHIRDDYFNNVLENDQTHYDEIINKHRLDYDSSDNKNIKNKSDWEARVRENENTRIIHQHVYDLVTLEKVMIDCGFKVLGTDIFLPHHMTIIAQKINIQIPIDVY